MFSTVRQDLTFAVRQFRRSPGFAVTAVLTLALGIGATTAIFSLIDGILLRPLPFPTPNNSSPSTLSISRQESRPPISLPRISSASSYPNFFDWQRQSHSFQSLASYDEIVRLFSKANGEGARVLEAAAFPQIYFRSSASPQRSAATSPRKKSGQVIASPFSATNSGFPISLRRPMRSAKP